MLYEFGVSVATIAERAGLGPGAIWDALKKARAEVAAEAGVSDSGNPEDSQPTPPRRLTRRTAQFRAMAYAEQHLISSLGLAANSFWVRIIVAIHEDGDGFRLQIGEPGARFPSRESLVDLFGRQEVVIDGWLAALIERGRLIDLDGVDLAIPFGLGLTPGENARGKVTAPRASSRRAKEAPPADQRRLLEVLSGGRSDSNEIHPPTQIKSPISFESDPPSTQIKSPISFESDGLACAATAAANAKDFQTLSSSSSNGSRERATQTKLGVSFESDSSEIPPADSNEINSQRSPVALLTEELAALAKLGRAPNAEDLAAVEGWLDLGETSKTLRTGIEIKMGQRIGKPPPSALRYFDGFLTERREARGRPARAPVSPDPAPAAPPPALSTEQQALMDRLAPFEAAHLKDRSLYPWPPKLADFGPASGIAALAGRWLDQAEGWGDHGRPRDLKPPDFPDVRVQRAQFEADLEAAEDALLEVLSRPDPPLAAD